MTYDKSWEATLIAYRDERNRITADYSDKTGELKEPSYPEKPVWEPALLSGLTLSNNVVLENSAAGMVIGSIQGKTPGSVITMTDNAGNRFSLQGGTIVVGSVPTNHESAQSHTVQITEEFAGAINSPRVTTLTINVTNVFEQPTLAALTMADRAFAVDDPVDTVIGAIAGKTAGSTLSISPAEPRVKIVGTNLVVNQVLSAPATFNVTIRETLADSSNNPRSTTFSISAS